MENVKLFLDTKTKNTRRSYRAAIEQLFQFAKDTGKTAYTLETCDAVMFLTRLQEEKSTATLSARHGALSAYYQFLKALKRVESNPFELAKVLFSARQQTQVRPTATFPISAIKKLLRLPRRNTKNDIRDRAILTVMFGSGVRRSEVVKLNLADIICTRRGRLIIQLRDTKSGKLQRQALRGRFAERVVELVSQRKSEGAENSSLLFCWYYKSGTPRSRLSESSLYRIFKHYAKLVGVNAAPHAARAAAITKLLIEGRSLLDVKRFARHKHWRTVETYDHRVFDVEKAPIPKFL